MGGGNLKVTWIGKRSPIFRSGEDVLQGAEIEETKFNCLQDRLDVRSGRRAGIEAVLQFVEANIFNRLAGVLEPFVLNGVLSRICPLGELLLGLSEGNSSWN